jgi:GT2 family glycosyltransferase
MPRIAINIVTWNSLKFLPEALESIRRQTFSDFILLIIDNASTDGTVEFVREKYPGAAILRNTRNLGFARGHNQGVAYAKAHLKGTDPLVLVTNPDIVLEPDFLEKLVDSVDRRPEFGSACGKLLKMRRVGEGEFVEGEKTDTIDSTGLLMMKSRRVADRGAGERDAGQFDRTEGVFGVTGALGLYRLKALEDVGLEDGPFDESFFAYKEDIDLAWRLRLSGHGALYSPAARAYHYRTAAGRARAGVREVVAGRRGRSQLIRRLSYRNHLLMLVKNEQGANFIRHFPRVLAYELGKLLYCLLREPASLRGLVSFLAMLPSVLRKRRSIMRKAVPAGEIRKWFQ